MIGHLFEKTFVKTKRNSDLVYFSPSNRIYVLDNNSMSYIDMIIRAHHQRNHSCDIAPKNAAAFDLTFARFCWAADCVICDDDVDDVLADVALLGDFACCKNEMRNLRD